jgi:MFS family permease
MPIVMARTDRAYYLIFGSYCCCWSAITPAYPLFLLSRGLDIFQCHLVLATFLIATFACEVPTGAVADLFGRKLSFLLSCVVRAVAFAMYAFAAGFGDCLIAEMVDALGQALASGALDAWAVDRLHDEGSGVLVDRLFARAQMIARVLMIAAGVVGGYTAEHSFFVAWMLGAVGFLVTGVMAMLLMRESPRPVVKRTAATYGNVGRTSRQALRMVRDVPVLRLLCIVTFGSAFAIMPAHMLWQPRMQQLTGQGAWLMGWIWALWNLAIVAGSAAVPALQRRWRREWVLLVSVVWRAVMFLIIALATTTSPALLGLVLGELQEGVSTPLLQTWMNEHITTERRATLLSVRAMAFTLGGSVGLGCVGFVALHFGMRAAWSVSAVALLLVAPVYLVLGRAARPPSILSPDLPAIDHR